MTHQAPPPPDLIRTLSLLAVTRTAYSSERSLMAWIRTSVSLYSFGFSISMFIDYLELQASDVQFSASMRRVGSILIAMAAAALAFAIFDHLKRMHTMKQLGMPPESPISVPVGAAVALLVVGILALLPLPL